MMFKRVLCELHGDFKVLMINLAYWTLAMYYLEIEKDNAFNKGVGFVGWFQLVVY